MPSPRDCEFFGCIKRLPLVEFLVHGTIVECGECGKWWRAIVPGNPEYAWWKRAWVRQRLSKWRVGTSMKESRRPKSEPKED